MGQLSCEIQPTDEASDLNITYEGQQGVRRRYVSEDSGVNLENIETRPDGVDKLAMHFEAPSWIADNVGNLFQAWF
jgi:hypothetical protein